MMRLKRASYDYPRRRAADSYRQLAAHYMTSSRAPSTAVPATALPSRNVAAEMDACRFAGTLPKPDPPCVVKGTIVLPERLTASRNVHTAADIVFHQFVVTISFVYEL